MLLEHLLTSGTDVSSVRSLGKTAFEAMTKRPNVSYLHTFDQTCFALINNPKKLEPRAERGISVGQSILIIQIIT